MKVDAPLKAIRQYHRMDQKKLAEKLDISPAHLCWIEKGKKTPTLEILTAYSRVFDIPLSSLIYFAEEAESKQRKPISEKTFKMLEWLELVTRDSK
jgi:transcriptional regulator with XRE-family HTH domain